MSQHTVVVRENSAMNLMDGRVHIICSCMKFDRNRHLITEFGVLANLSTVWGIRIKKAHQFLVIIKAVILMICFLFFYWSYYRSHIRISNISPHMHFYSHLSCHTVVLCVCTVSRDELVFNWIHLRTQANRLMTADPCSQHTGSKTINTHHRPRARAWGNKDKHAVAIFATLGWRGSRSTDTLYGVQMPLQIHSLSKQVSRAEIWQRLSQTSPFIKIILRWFLKEPCASI